MHGFFDNSKSHFADDQVYLQANDFLPFEAAFRFLRAVDPTMLKDRKFNIIVDDSSSANCSEGNNPDETYLVIHRLSSDNKERVNEGAKQEKCEDVIQLNKFLEAMHYDARVLRRENVTHIFWFQRISSCPSIYIKISFSLRILCPTLFEEGKPIFCDEFKKVMSFIDKDDYNGAWGVIEPYFIELRKVQWLKDLKTMFINSYDKQIVALKDSINDYYERVRSLREAIANQFKVIEDAEVRMRGMLASNSTEKNYEEFVNYINDVGAEILDFSDKRLQIRFYGFIDQYDPDVAADIISTTNSFLYHNVNSENKADAKLVLQKTFVDEKYKIRVVSTHNVKQNMYSIHCDEYEHRPSSAVYKRDGKTYLYNPHLWHHDCYGDRRGEIEELIKTYDYYPVAMFANAANSNVGFGDPTVMEKFGADIIRNRTEKFFYCPADGQDYSFDEVLAKEKEVTE